MSSEVPSTGAAGAPRREPPSPGNGIGEARKNGRAGNGRNAEARDASLLPGFLARQAAILGILVAIGAGPTHSKAGVEGLEAGAVALGAAWIASLAGAIPLLAPGLRDASEVVSRSLGSIAIRLVVVLVLGLVAGLAGPWDLAVLLVWLAIAHAGLLVADTALARRVLRNVVGPPDQEPFNR